MLAVAEGSRTVGVEQHIDPVDTTAAGDVFNGALAVALSEDLSLQEAVRFASAVDVINDLDGLEGLLSLIGGKATTLRAMAEKAADLIRQKTPPKS